MFANIYGTLKFRPMTPTANLITTQMLLNWEELVSMLNWPFNYTPTAIPHGTTFHYTITIGNYHTTSQKEACSVPSPLSCVRILLAGLRGEAEMVQLCWYWHTLVHNHIITEKKQSYRKVLDQSANAQKQKQKCNKSV